MRLAVVCRVGTVYRLSRPASSRHDFASAAFTQDERSLFVTPEQIEAEMRGTSSWCYSSSPPWACKTTEFASACAIRRATSTWADERLEQRRAHDFDFVKNVGMNYTPEVGEAAFYGPKIDLWSELHRPQWQLARQLDYQSSGTLSAGVRPAPIIARIGR